MPRLIVGVYFARSPFLVLCAPEPVLLCRTVAGVIGAARFGVGSVIAPWRSAQFGVSVPVGSRAPSASAAARFRCLRSSSDFGTSSDSAAPFVNLGRQFSVASSARVAVCSGVVFVPAVRHNPWLRATQRRAVVLARAVVLS